MNWLEKQKQVPEILTRKIRKVTVNPKIKLKIVRLK